MFCVDPQATRRANARERRKREAALSDYVVSVFAIPEEGPRPKIERYEMRARSLKDARRTAKRNAKKYAQPVEVFVEGAKYASY